ncbi:MAG TPA: AbrB/MazE/SpoVT family DNA-binding domain-containing protein [Ktedonobacteraceae bacterium]|jgi:putative addiction module antidote|nr:AbrB/MazE/SpoVT family DNA-binding domain-containing protein [Ktedonobacteraceae bacterium]
MIWQKLRKVGNSYVVTIPKEEIERQNLHEGQLLAVEIQPAEIRPVLSPELRKAFEESWQRNEEAYRYMAEH